MDLYWKHAIEWFVWKDDDLKIKFLTINDILNYDTSKFPQGKSDGYRVMLNEIGWTKEFYEMWDAFKKNPAKAAEYYTWYSSPDHKFFEEYGLLNFKGGKAFCQLKNNRSVEYIEHPSEDIINPLIEDIKKRIRSNKLIEVVCKRTEDFNQMAKKMKEVKSSKVVGDKVIIETKTSAGVDAVMKKAISSDHIIISIRKIEPTLEEAFIDIVSKG